MIDISSPYWRRDAAIFGSMKELSMRQYQWIWIGFVLSLGLYILLHLTGWDWFEKLALLFDHYDHYEVDELFISGIVLAVFFIIDVNHRKKRAEIELEKAAIYKAMLTSTQHVMNNFLNKMQLFKFTAEGIPDFPQEILAKYDEISQEATAQIKALNNITHISPEVIAESVAPKAVVDTGGH